MQVPVVVCLFNSEKIKYYPVIEKLAIWLLVKPLNSPFSTKKFAFEFDASEKIFGNLLA